MSVFAQTKSEGAGLGGNCNANAWNALTLTNAIWTDDADYTAKNIYLYVDNGGTLKEKNDQYRLHLVADSYARLDGIGKLVPDSRITGTMINQIRAFNTSSVTFNATGTVIHKTSKPAEAVWQDAKTGIDRIKVLGIPLASDKSKSLLVWYVFNRCDFCGEGTQVDVERTAQESLKKRYEDAFGKALAPINEIARAIASPGTTKARYGEEETQTSAALYVLELRSMLKKDALIPNDRLSRYQLWTNTRTYLNVSLLPNAARLYANASGRLQYAVDLLKGDLFLNGSDLYVEILSALTKWASGNSIIPIGSTGSLDLASGVFTLPDLPTMSSICTKFPVPG